MTAHTPIAKPLDDIRHFMSAEVGPEEYALRAKLRTFKNCAASMIASTKSDQARTLAWMASDYATGTIYAPTTLAVLDNIVKLCNRLMLTAVQAEQTDAEGAWQ
ncbi:hypothetical protein WJT74_07735 [Sphingomicrobium sp. XHP0239]|uniref:hypothetical protein n=1 Tax=Sphingomicrobium maritimum TaxID=3133972 RepID=UPI0031CC42B4